MVRTGFVALSERGAVALRWETSDRASQWRERAVLTSGLSQQLTERTADPSAPPSLCDNRSSPRHKSPNAPPARVHTPEPPTASRELAHVCAAPRVCVGGSAAASDFVAQCSDVRRPGWERVRALRSRIGVGDGHGLVVATVRWVHVCPNRPDWRLADAAHQGAIRTVRGGVAWGASSGPLPVTSRPVGRSRPRRSLRGTM
jgi:hypothetical protein